MAFNVVEASAIRAAWGVG